MLSTRHKFLILFAVIFLPALACGGVNHLESAREAAAEGDVATAMEEYAQVIEGESEPADQFAALAERAALHWEQEDAEAALADYAQALTVATEDGSPAGNPTQVYNERAEIYVAQEDWAAVVENLNRVLEANPDNFQAMARRGYAHLQLRNFEQAIADLKGSLQGDVDSASADLDNRRNLVTAYYDLGQAMLNLGEYEEAVQNHTEALALAEDDELRAEILAARGFVYSETDQYEKALTDLDQAIALQPEMALPYAYRSYVYSDQGQYEASIADASKAVELGSDLNPSRRSSIFHARALAYFFTNQYEQAVADATEAIQLAGPEDPGAARTYNIRSQTLRVLGDYEGAIADASKAIELGSTDVTALSAFYRNRALAYYFSDNLAPALEDVEAAISIDADEPNATNFDLLARIQYEQGEYEAAISSFQQALALASDDPWLHNGLGDAYYELDDYGSAETEYRAAIRLDDSEPLFHENLGLVLRLTERYQEAVDSYSQALALSEERPFAWLGRGLAHYNLGQTEQAVSDLQTVLTFELDPDTTQFVQDALTQISGGG